MGAAAASAAAAALSAFVYNAPGSAVGPSAPTMSPPAPIGNNMNGAKPFQQPTAITTPPTNAPGAPQADWFSNYQAPTIQQRMAVTMAANAANLTGGGVGGGQPHHYANGQPPRGNFQRGGHQQQHQRGGRNQRGKRQQQQGGMPKQNQHPNQNQQNKQHQQNKGSGAAGSSAASGDVEMESSGFHCDACDVTFHEEAKLKTHIAAHRSCPDCQYKASPSLVSEHRKVTHGAAGSSGPTTLSSMMASSSPSASGWTTSAGVGVGQEQGKPQKSKSEAIDHDLLHPLAPTLETPEDIAAWIAQRRKAWPTESNIQKKVRPQ